MLPTFYKSKLAKLASQVTSEGALHVPSAPVVGGGRYADPDLSRRGWRCPKEGDGARSGPGRGRWLHVPRGLLPPAGHTPGARPGLSAPRSATSPLSALDGNSSLVSADCRKQETTPGLSGFAALKPLNGSSEHLTRGWERGPALSWASRSHTPAGLQAALRRQE